MLGTAACSPGGQAAPGNAVEEVAVGNDSIPRAPSTPGTPKNWAGPQQKILAQTLVDELAAAHPEVVSITIHAVPPGLSEYSMIAGTFPDRIGNMSSPGDIITAKKGATQVESKWGTENYGKKVSIVLPLKNKVGDYIPVAMVVAFKQSPDSGKIDTDFMQPGIVIRDGLNSRIENAEALFSPV
ncbi:hypothetical protein D1610_06915 [Sphingomonas gilva]|uniref:Uncharacterized protein n=2 Tax=Sphingomonas gilva TaxID=2305907 RepID=A0A396S461_9SPHN|nr:hypothetical protein D1610_06915 [Sphingomonas gilva]